MSRKVLLIGLGVVALGVGWYLFRPELLFVKTTVSEALPSAAPGKTVAEPVALSRGSFHSVAHETKGVATLYRLDNGKRVLRFTEFTTSNGPDVQVYLVAAPDSNDAATVKKAGFIHLGALKGTTGDQNYDVPADADLAKYQSVTVWCRRFGVNFGTAPLTPPQT